MGKKTKKKDKDLGCVTECEESVSATTVLSETKITLESDKLFESIDQLTEKRGSLRESALSSLINLIRINGITLLPDIQRYSETLNEQLCRFLKRPNSENEGILACQVLGLVVLVSGDEDDNILELFGPLLENLVTRSQYNLLRIEAILTLSLVSLVCSSMPEPETMNFCENVCCGESDALLVDRYGIILYSPHSMS